MRSILFYTHALSTFPRGFLLRLESRGSWGQQWSVIKLKCDIILQGGFWEWILK